MTNWYEKCKEYYPEYWDINRLKQAVKLKKITKAQFKEITGEDYSA